MPEPHQPTNERHPLFAGLRASWRQTLVWVPAAAVCVLLALVAAAYGEAQYRCLGWIVRGGGSASVRALPIGSVVVDKSTWGNWQLGVPPAALLAPARSVFLGPGCGDADAWRLNQIPYLTKLDMICARMGDPAMTVVAHLRELRSLRVERASVTDVGAAVLRSLRRLRLLDLSHTKVDDGALFLLEPLHRLRTLLLAGDDIRGSGIPALARLPRLDQLDLSDTRITDTRLRGLVGLKNLRRLNLSNTRVAGAGLIWLRRMPNLRVVFLSGTRCTRESIKALLRSRPKLRVYRGAFRSF